MVPQLRQGYATGPGLVRPTLLVLGVAKMFVDVATELITGGAVVLPLVGVPADPVRGLYLLGALLLAVWLLDKAAWGAEEVVQTYATNRAESYVHALIMRKCSALDAAFYESPSISTCLSGPCVAP